MTVAQIKHTNQQLHPPTCNSRLTMRVMAGVATLSISLGRPTRTLRLLAITVIATIFFDPLLAWSVGYYMSVGDRGMISQKAIDQDLKALAGLAWITALKSGQIRSLLEGKGSPSPVSRGRVISGRLTVGASEARISRTRDRVAA